jgi:hypothetical protein
MEAVSAAQIECPYCTEAINAKSRKCRHCGEILDPQLREIEFLKSQRGTPQVFMNGGGGGAAAASSAASSSGDGTSILRRFPHWLHILLVIFTGFLWVPIYILAFMFRNRTVYY